MGSAGKAMVKVAKAVGAVKEVPQPMRQAMQTSLTEGVDKVEQGKVATATAVEKQSAAARRARRMGQRQLLAGGRLGSGTDEEGLKTTLG